MSLLKKKQKLKDKSLVSHPLSFEHVQHIGPLDVPPTVGDNSDTVADPPTPCNGPDVNNNTKVILKFIQSNDFQEALRNIVKEELEGERGKLLKEIENIRQLPIPCTLDAAGETWTSEANTSQSTSVENSAELDQGDPDVSHRFENPLYDEDQTALKVKPSPAPRMTIGSNSRDTFPKQGTDDMLTAVKQQFKQRTVSKPRAALRMSKNDERECMSQALQSNIVALVDRLQFNLTDLPDQLITSGHMTEDECRMIRYDVTSRKDQVRYLVSRTKCRDLKDIEKFLQLVEGEIPDVVAKIRAQFDENKKNNVKCTTCALCQCSVNVDIKDAVDILWSMRAVSDGFYNEVVASGKPRGSQDTLWRSLVDICNGKQTKERQKVYGILFDFIQSKGNFDFIVKPLKCMLDKTGRLDCNCSSTIKNSLSERSSYGVTDRESYGVISSCSPRSSISGSQRSTFSGEFSQEVERYSDNYLEERLGRDYKIHRPLTRQAAFDTITAETSPKQQDFRLTTMNQLRKKAKLKTKKEDISTPTDLKHLKHIGPHELAVNLPETCYETDWRQDQVLSSTPSSEDFQKTLRNIVKEEMVKTLDIVMPKLMQGIISQLQPNLIGTTACMDHATQSYSKNYSTTETDNDSNRPCNKQDLNKGRESPVKGVLRAQSEPKYHRNEPSINRVQSEPKYLRNSSYLRPGAAVRRECLSRALQANVIPMVDRLQFNLSTLPEQLIGAGHITEDECKMIRDDLSRKDQIRYIISRTKSRDLQDIETFLELIEREVPDVVAKIHEQFEENIKTNNKYTTCSLCLCSNNIDIKDATDILWSMGVVSDGFYNEVVACPKPRGGQGHLWKTLVEICNNKPMKEKQKVYGKLFQFIRKKGNFEFIVKPLQLMLERDDRIECHCYTVLKPNMVSWGSCNELSYCSPRSSTSGASEGRLSSFSGDFSSLKEGDLAEDRARKERRTDARKFQRQSSLCEDTSQETIVKQRLYHAASLDGMLDTITEETNKCMKRGSIVNQTLEFYRPEYDRKRHLLVRLEDIKLCKEEN